jgi:hypothetical protein
LHTRFVPDALLALFVQRTGPVRSKSQAVPTHRSAARAVAMTFNQVVDGSIPSWFTK